MLQLVLYNLLLLLSLNCLKKPLLIFLAVTISNHKTPEKDSKKNLESAHSEIDQQTKEA